MRIFDLLLIVVLAVWWLKYRKTHDWKRVVLYYMGGVALGDVTATVLIITTKIVTKRIPNDLSVLGLLMPIGGIIGLIYGAYNRKLSKSSVTN